MSITVIIVLIVAIVSGLLFLAFFLPKMWREFEVMGFLKHPVTNVLLLLFLGVSLGILLPYDFRFIAEALIVVSVIGLLLELPHMKDFYQNSLKEVLEKSNTRHPDLQGEWFDKTRYPDLQGEWSYEVRDSRQQLMYKGDCTIEQTSSEVDIFGTMTYSRWEGQSEMTLLSGGGIPWSTEWGFIRNLKLYYGYRINTPDGKFEGYCDLTLRRGTVDKMSGDYFYMAPNKMHGSIRFKRKVGEGNGEALPTA